MQKHHKYTGHSHYKAFRKIISLCLEDIVKTLEHFCEFQEIQFQAVRSFLAFQCSLPKRKDLITICLLLIHSPRTQRVALAKCGKGAAAGQREKPRGCGSISVLLPY